MKLLKFLLVVGLVVGVVEWFLVAVPFGPATETFVEIAPGTGTAAMAEQLQQAGVIRSALAFEAMKKYRGGSLKAGEYRFEGPATLGDVYARIRKGDVYTISLTIPEGYNVFDVAAAVEAAGLGSRAVFLAAEQQHGELVAAWSPGASSVEGFLFPDTYRFSRHATAVEMLSAMVRRFGQVAEKLGIRAEGHGPRSALEVVTMASLVEREVHLDSERATVAGVFTNRLAAGMPLQTDPAVAYASMLRGTWTGVIHQSELHSDSAYNTYTHAGLPPGPICNPGIAALKAAMQPERNEYLYFVATSGGATRFARTLEEHAANVVAYRAGR